MMSIIGAPLRPGKWDDITRVKMAKQEEVNWDMRDMKVEIMGVGAPAAPNDEGKQKREMKLLQKRRLDQGKTERPVGVAGTLHLPLRIDQRRESCIINASVFSGLPSNNKGEDDQGRPSDRQCRAVWTV